MSWSVFVWDVVAVVWWAWALWLAVRRPVGRYELGWPGKLGAVLVVCLLWVTMASCFVPLGAIAVSLRLRQAAAGPDVPMASGWPGDIG